MRPGNNQRCSGATPASRRVGRAFHHCRSRSRISAGSITFRSLRPFDCTMRMIICSLSMSHARSRTTSLARNPQPYASVSIARALRLVAMVRTRLTSSGLNTGGSFCGSWICQISAARSWRRSVTRNRKRTPVMIRFRLQMLAPPSTRCSWKRRTSSGVAVSGERLSQAANRLQLGACLLNPGSVGIESPTPVGDPDAADQHIRFDVKAEAFRPSLVARFPWWRSSPRCECGEGRSPPLSELQDIVGEADEAPFGGDLLDAPQEELTEAARLLDLSEHRLGQLLS